MYKVQQGIRYKEMKVQACSGWMGIPLRVPDPLCCPGLAIPFIWDNPNSREWYKFSGLFITRKKCKVYSGYYSHHTAWYLHWREAFSGWTHTTLCDQHICKFDKFDRMLVNLLNDVRKRTLYQTCNSAGYQSGFEAIISSVPLLVHSIVVYY